MSKKPLLTYLSEKELDSIIEESLKLLENTGVYVPNGKAKKILKKAGAKEKNKDTITLSRDIVKLVLDNHTNSRFKLYDQTGTKFLQLEIGNTFYGPGSDLQYIIDMKTEKPKQTQLIDVAKNITIIDNLPQFDFLMSTGLPFDLKSENLYPEVFKTMILNSDKPIIATATTVQDIEKIHEIASQVAGSEKAFKEKPFYAAYLEPVSPLKIEEDIANKIIFCAKKGIPMLFAAGANISVQAPGTPEGAVIQGTAESLSGMVLAYLTNPDVKFIFGANSADFDGNKGIISYGGPGWSKTMAYYTELARKLNLPVWGAAGCTDSNKIDAQAGAEAAMSLLMAELCGATLIHDIGYLSHGNLTDPRAYVFNSELIDRVRWLANRGLIIPGEVIPIIDGVKKGKISTFLDAEHTFENYNSCHHPQKWIDRSNHDEEQKTLLEKLKEEVYQIWEKHPPIIDADVKPKRKLTKEIKKEKIEIKKTIKQQNLEELFKEDPDKSEKVRVYLTEKLEAGEKPEELYKKLVDAFASTVQVKEGEEVDLIYSTAYARKLKNVEDVLTSQMKDNTLEKTPFILGTVEGDVHYVGKNLVAQLASVSSYKVIDEGLEVPTGKFILSALDNEACLIGLSALLTTTRDNMKKTIKTLKALSMKDQVGIIIGGAVIDKAYAGSIGADAYRKNAGEVGQALDEMKDFFISTYKRKNITPKNLLLIGESINSANEKVKNAIKDENEKFLLDLAKKQIKKGARYLDIAVPNLGNIENQKEAIQWVVQTLQRNLNLPLCLDSDDYRVIEAALKVYDQSKGSAIINSTSLDEERKENMVRLATEYNSNIVFQAADGQTLDLKLWIVDQFIEYASKQGLPNERIFIDPGLETMAEKPESAKLALQTISTLKDKYPSLHYTVGLTNIGFGFGELSKTKALQQVFLNIGRRIGLDSAITNPSILTYEFKDRNKALPESIEFIASLFNNFTYREKIKSPAYEIK